MTFARVTGCQEEDEPDPLYATREGGVNGNVRGGVAKGV